MQYRTSEKSPTCTEKTTFFQRLRAIVKVFWEEDGKAITTSAIVAFLFIVTFHFGHILLSGATNFWEAVVTTMPPAVVLIYLLFMAVFVWFFVSETREGV